MTILRRKVMTVQAILCLSVLFSVSYIAKRLRDSCNVEYGLKAKYFGLRNLNDSLRFAKNIPIIQLFDHWSWPPQRCSVPCTFRGGRKLLPQADAVFFPDPMEEKITTMKLERQNRQIWIFHFQESPHSSNYVVFPNSEVYNWTLTYRHDSDVVSRFYGHYSFKKGAKITPEEFQGLSNHSLPIPEEKLKKLGEKYLNGKTKLMAWTSSHNNCVSVGGREVLVRLLDETLGVSKFGTCGPNKCPYGHSNISSCYEQQSKDYKFYLAFENSLCKDYVTEKLFFPLKLGMVPIGYAGVDYSRHAPPGSYIDALSFPTVAALTDHIKFLDKNPKEYLKYFLWTEYYEIWWPEHFHRWWLSPSIQWCQLCEKLWSVSVVDEKDHRTIDPKYSKIYPNVSTWYNFELSERDDEGKFDPTWTPTCRPPPKLKIF